MSLSRVAPRCLSRNAFSPSTALWKYFVASQSPIYTRCAHRRPYSIAQAGTESPGSQSTEASVSVNPFERETEGTTDDNGGLRMTLEDIPKSRPSRRVFGPRKGYVSKLNLGEKPVPAYKPLSEYTPREIVWKSMVNAMSYMHQVKYYYRKQNDYRPKAAHPAWIINPETGKYVPTLGNPRELPWVTSMYNSLSKYSILNFEIPRFHKYIKPSRNETLARKALVERVTAHLKEYLPDMDVEVFGSQRTGLADALSDIDLRLYRPKEKDAVKPPVPMTQSTKFGRRQMLNDLANHLDQLYYDEKSTREQTDETKVYSAVEVVDSRYPLVHLKDRKTGLNVQIVLSNDSSASRKAIAKYIEEYPWLPELFSVVKTMFDVRGMSDVFLGGLGSYSIFMMIVASLKHGIRPTTGLPPQTVGEAFCHFLTFWSYFDYSKGVSIEPPVLFDKYKNPVGTPEYLAELENGSRKPQPKWMLCLKDPADPTNDLGRKGIAMKHVVLTMKALKSDLGPGEYGVLWPLVVGAVHDLQAPMRNKLNRVGADLYYVSQREKQMKQRLEAAASKTKWERKKKNKAATPETKSERTEKKKSADVAETGTFADIIDSAFVADSRDAILEEELALASLLDPTPPQDTILEEAGAGRALGELETLVQAKQAAASAAASASALASTPKPAAESLASPTPSQPPKTPATEPVQPVDPTDVLRRNSSQWL